MIPPPFLDYQPLPFYGTILDPPFWEKCKNSIPQAFIQAVSLMPIFEQTLSFQMLQIAGGMFQGAVSSTRGS